VFVLNDLLLGDAPGSCELSSVQRFADIVFFFFVGFVLWTVDWFATVT